MPGKLGVKLIPRRSVSGKYHSVREFVFALLDKKPTITKEEAEKFLIKEYPKSSFFGKDGKGGHFTWYKHKWNKMKLEKEFTLSKQAHGEEHEPVSHESKKSKARRVKRVGRQRVAKVANRKKDRRVSVHKNQRKVDVKTRQTVLQRRANSKGTRQPPKTQEVHDRRGTGGENVAANNDALPIIES